jgi:predicted ATPase/DNA-binding CsgD family transcriptional regulator
VTAADVLTDAGVSEREAEVLALLGDHLTNAEISARLFISVRTVESHVSSLLRKLAVGDRRALAELASRLHHHGGGAPVPARPVPMVLPAPLTSFVGRAAERAALADAVQQRRLVTAVGPGGVGKTRLALAVAADVAERFDDGVWYVDLVPVSDPAMIAPAVAAALGVGEQSGRSIDETVIARLAGARALVVLDNAEHLVDGVVVFVERLLGACPRVAVLATSRARLLVPFEWTFPVSGLSVDPGPGDGDGKGEGDDGSGDGDSRTDDGGVGDAVALFVERAAAVGGAPPGPDDRRRIAAICRDLDGMALAIELAAARLPTLGIDGLEAGLADQLQMLAGGQRLDDRHRSLRAMLDWSCALLDADDGATLRWVSLFANPFTADDAAAVVGRRDAAGALARLADQSLLVVVPSPTGTRYRMLETIRQYGTARLDEAGEQVAARTAHLRWCLATASVLLDDADPDRAAWRAAFDAVADDMRAALGWAEHQTEDQTDHQADQQAEDHTDQRVAAHDLALRLAGLTYIRGLVGEAQRRYLQAAGLTTDDAAVAAALRLASGAAQSRHLGDAALQLRRDAAAAAVRAGRQGDAAHDLALAATMLRRAPGMIAELPPDDAADELLGEAWRCSLRAAEPDLVVDAALLTAEAFNGVEVDPLTFELSRRAVELGRRSGDPVAESAALDQLTAVQLATGEIPQALASVRRRIEMLTPLPPSASIGMEVADAYQMAAETSLGAGDLPGALRFAEHVHGLGVYREEPHLGTARLLTVEALIGHWDRVVEMSSRFRESWERAGRQVAANLALGAGAVGMVFGLRGDDDQRAEWQEIVSVLRAAYTSDTHDPVVFNPMFDAILWLHRGDPGAALAGLGREPEQLREWFSGLWIQWYAALWAEASVLAGHPAADARLARARFLTAGNPVASALADRAEALAAGDPARLPTVAAALDAAGCLYQSARTLALAGGDAGRRGEAALAALGAAPMAAAAR